MNNPRANHEVYPVPEGYCVKFSYKHYVVSIAADGEDTLVCTANGTTLKVIVGAGLEQVAEAWSYINDQEKE